MIRLKAVVMDVASGHWETLTPEVYTDNKTTSKINRQQKDQQLVEMLKTKANKRLIDDLRTWFE